MQPDSSHRPDSTSRPPQVDGIQTSSLFSTAGPNAAFSSPVSASASPNQADYLDSLETLDQPYSSANTSASYHQPELSRKNWLSLSSKRAVIVSAIITAVVLAFVLITSLFVTKNDKAQDQARANLQSQQIELKNPSSASIPSELTSAEQSLLVNGDIITRSNLKVSSGGYVSILKTSLLSGDQTYLLPDSSGTFCLDGNNCNFATQDQLDQLRGQIPTQTSTSVQAPASGLQSITAGSSNLSITTNGGNVRISDTTANNPKVNSLNNKTGSLQLQGTTNRINISGSGNVLTLSTPQDINTGASPTFAAINVGNLAASGATTLAGSLQLSGLDCSANANGGALTTTTTGQVICSDDDGGAGSAIGGTGTAGTIPVFTAAQSIADSLLSQAAGVITADGDLDVTGAVTAASFSGNGSSVTNVNAAQLNGQTGSYYQNAGNLNAGTLSNLRLDASVSLLGQTIGLSELETNSVDSSKVVNSSIANIDLTNSSLTVTSGTGLSGGGSVALGGSTTLNLANTTVTPGSYGDSSNAAQFTVDAQGRLTSASQVSIAGLDSCSSCVSLQSTTPGTAQTGHINVNGTIIASNFSGNGSSVTNVNAAQLNGQTGSYYQNAGNINTGTLADARLSSNVSLLGQTIGNTEIETNAVSLGTQTTGNYQTFTTAGDGIAVTGSASEGSNPSVAVDASVCRTSGNCIGDGSGGDVLQGGNSLGTALTIGTNDNFGFNLETNNATRLSISNTGILGLTNTTAYNCSSLGNSGKLTVDGSGTIVCATDIGGSGGTVGGSGTAGQLTKFTGVNTIGDSIISEAATTITVAGNLVATALQGDGSAITNLDGSNIATGTVANARLVNSGSLTVTSGTGLSGGGSVALGGSTTLNLANTTVTPGSYGDSSNAAQFTVDAQGRLTSASQVSIAGLDSCSSCVSLQSTTPGTAQTGHINVNGTIIASNFSGNGSSVTNVNAAQLGGQTGSYYRNADNINAGTLAVNYGGTGANSLTAGGILFGNGTGAITNSGVLSNGQLLIGDGSGAPNVSTLSEGTGVIITNGAGSITIAADPNSCPYVYFCGGASSSVATRELDNLQNVAINTSLLPGTTSIDIGSTAKPFRDLYLGGTATNNFRITGTAGGSRVYTLPDVGSNASFCLSTGNCAGSGGGLTGSGTNGKIAKFTGAGSLGDSILTESGSTITVGGTLSATNLQGAGANITALDADNISTGTLAVARGGTGQSSYTDGQLLIGNSTGNTLSKATLTAGTGVNIVNGSGSITISAASAGTCATCANQSLSNLTATSINQSLIADSTNTRDLGSNAVRFKDLYLQGTATVAGAINGLTLGSTSVQSSSSIALVAAANQDLTLTRSGTGNIVFTGLDCSALGNGGKLTANGSGVVSCATDTGAGPATTLQQAYDNSGSPATIVTSATAKDVIIQSGTGFNSFSAFQVQNASNQIVLGVDTSGGSVLIGQRGSLTGKLVVSNATNSNAVTLSVGTTSTSYDLILPTSAGSAGDCLINSATPGVLTFGVCPGGGGGGSGSTVSLMPEYPGGLLTADGSNNSGIMTSDSVSGLSGAQGYKQNFYEWSTDQTSAQDYDIVVNYRLPSDFTSFAASSFKIWTYADTLTNTDVTLMIKDNDGTSCYASATSIKPSSGGTWQEKNPSNPANGCTFAAGDVITFIIKPTAITPQTNKVRVGEIRFGY